MLQVKSSDQAARAELRNACWVTAVQQEHAQAAAVDARHEGSQATANMAGEGAQFPWSSRGALRRPLTRRGA